MSKLTSMLSGLITLPMILHTLSPEEIAMNYILISIISITALFDLGFSPQFSRNFSYIYGGSQEITSCGVPIQNSNFINYQLLYHLIESAKLLYKLLSSLLGLFLFSIGTIYMYNFTDGFTLFDNSIYIWLVFALSIVIDFYFRFYTPLLMGSGQIKEINQIEFIANVLRILIVFILLLLGFRLWSVVAGQIVRIIVIRYMSTRVFYSERVKQIFAQYKQDCFDKIIILKKLWYNAKKSLTVSICTYASTQLSTIFAGLYLSHQEIASYGLLTQLVSVITVVSILVNGNMIPIYATLRSSGSKNDLYISFCNSLGFFILLSIVGYLCLFIAVPYLLSFIGSNAVLPSISIVLIYSLYKILENNHCICTSYLTSKNHIVDFESSLLIGIGNVICQLLVLHYSSWGLLGLVLVQFLLPLCYPNWKWPLEVSKEFGISYPKICVQSLSNISQLIKNQISKVIESVK